MPGVYRPVSGVVLYARLDELFDQLPGQTVEALLSDAPATGDWTPDGRWRRLPDDPGSPKTYYLQTVPRNVSLTHNPYYQADTMDVTIRWSDLPVDVRLLRSIGVACYMGTVDHAKWGQYMNEGVAATPFDRRIAGNVVHDFVDVTKLRFSGFADDGKVKHDDSGSYLSMECRDWTRGLMIPAPSKIYKPGALNWDTWIEEVVLQLIEACSPVADAHLHIMGFEPGTVKFQRGQSHTAGQSGKKPTKSRKIKGETFWELLTDICVNNGLLIYADVYQGPDPTDSKGKPMARPTGRFVLAKPTKLFSPVPQRVHAFRAKRDEKGKFVRESVGNPWNIPPFSDRGRPMPGDKTGTMAADAPCLLYGNNLRSLGFSRRFADVQVPTIEAVCTTGKKTLRARFPESQRANYVAPTGTWASKQPIRQYTLNGYEKIADLKEAARQIFEQIGRGDMKMEWETRDMASFKGDNADPDLLELRPGSPVRAMVAKVGGQEYGSDVIAYEKMSRGELAAQYKSRGMDPEVAENLAAAMSDPATKRALQTFWYVREVTHELDADDGYSNSGEATNWLEARINKEKANG